MAGSEFNTSVTVGVMGVGIISISFMEDVEKSY